MQSMFIRTMAQMSRLHCTADMISAMALSVQGFMHRINYERSHMDGVENTYKLLKNILQNSIIVIHYFMYSNKVGER